MKSQWMAVVCSGIITSTSVLRTAAQTKPNSLTQLFPALIGVQLTTVQQTQLANLSHQTLPQVQALLTPKQQAQFNAALAQDNGVRIAASRLTLSIRQQLQLSKILQTMRSQITPILTLEQQRQVWQNLQTMQQQGR